MEWVEPFNEQVGAVGAVYARSWSGIAARQQLDIPLALRRFREAFETGTAVGPHSYAARIAGAVLGEMLYETGELDEAAELLEESYHLGPEGAESTTWWRAMSSAPKPKPRRAIARPPPAV